MSDPTAAEWLSAWSTFWGAIATGVGTIATAGAFWLAAIVYRRQEQDQRRAQASAVTVSISRASEQRDIVAIELRNDSHLPVYNIVLISAINGQDSKEEARAALPPGEKIRFQMVFEPVLSAYALYIDAAGRKWCRYFNGDLVEISSESRTHSKPVSLEKALSPVKRHLSKNQQ